MKIWFTLLISLLIAANFLALYFLEEFVDRWFRFGTTAVFLLLYAFNFFTNKRLLSIFILLAICDGLLVFYEIPILKKLIYAVRILAYINLILLVAPHLSKLRLNIFTVSITIFVIIIDLYLLHDMANSLPAVDQEPVFLGLFYGLGIISLAIVVVSLSYLNRYSNRKSFLLVIVSFGCILSDVFFYNAYYLGFEEFFYLDRLTNIIGVAALLLYARKLLIKPENAKPLESF